MSTGSPCATTKLLGASTAQGVFGSSRKLEAHLTWPKYYLSEHCDRLYELIAWIPALYVECISGLPYASNITAGTLSGPPMPVTP